MAYGYEPKQAKAHPYLGALYAVLDSVTKIAALGGDTRTVRMSFQEYFGKLTDEEAWGQPLAALLGGLTAQKELEVPAIGGKDSMSGTFMDINVPPALLSFAITTMEADEVVSTEFKTAGDKVVFLPCVKDDRGMPDFKSYRRAMDKVRELAAAKEIKAAAAVGYGGVFLAVAKMALGNGIGCTIENIKRKELVGRGYGGLVLELSTATSMEDLFGDIPFTVLGDTNEEGDIIIKVEARKEIISKEELRTTWEAPLEGVFPVTTGVSERDKARLEKDLAEVPSKPCCLNGPAIKVARPKVIIPAFPGTNCEMDSKRAFDRAGADSEIFLVRNMTKDALEQSITGLAAKIKESQIVMIPGGFSGGDEPDGSAKFITAVFRSPAIREAVADLLENRDGLMLGICNGFQALIKLGLVPYGKIVDATEDSPTLTYNRIGRHQSGLVQTNSTKKNLEMRVEAENGATAGKVAIAKKAKELGLDAIHDTVHEMARDEARHGKAFKGLLERYFG